MIVRGTPHKDDPVHLIRPSIRGMGRNQNTYCYQGSWHILYTDDLEKVTCQKCLEARLKG